MERLYISLQDCVVVPNCEIGTNLKITNTKIDYKLLNCGRSLIVAYLLFTAVKLIVFLPRVAMVKVACVGTGREGGGRAVNPHGSFTSLLAGSFPIYFYLSR